MNAPRAVSRRGRFMIHLALWEGDEVIWLEHVTDDEYRRADTDA
ncbi:hypothetical protein [Nocardia harenae]|nr:hypothetical protein [Nocardia harenae]